MRMPLPVWLAPAPSPSCPSGKARKFSGRREHGTPDHLVLPALFQGTAVRSAPGRYRAEAGFIAGFPAVASDSTSLGAGDLLVDRTDAVGKLHGHQGTL